MIDSTQHATDALSVMSGSTSAATSRPSTAGPNRAASGKKAADLTKAVTNALSEGVMVSAADCLHACHAHLTDPQNFWKCINDA
jgi:hypothetical protein